MKYVALLRGINVGGKSVVRMTDLKAAFESAGFSQSLPAASASSSNAWACALSGVEVGPSGVGTCNSCSWFGVKSASAAIASTPASGVR